MTSQNKGDFARVLAFLKAQHLAAIATCSLAGDVPESALIAFAEDEKLCLYFQTSMRTRKAKNLATNPNVSLVIGLDLQDQATLQYEGVVERLNDSQEINTCKQRFLAKGSPTTLEYLERPGTGLFKVTPAWIRHTFYEMKSHGSIIELKDFLT